MAAAQRLALQLPPRRAAQDELKKATISRAEGGQLQAPVGRQPRFMLSQCNIPDWEFNLRWREMPRVQPASTPRKTDSARLQQSNARSTGLPTHHQT